MTGIELIAAERKRQIEEEGFTAEHDEQHREQELSLAAACYALPYEIRHDTIGYYGWSKLLSKLWPWHEDWYKPYRENRINELKKAGALIAAEIDRLLMLEGKK
jgi:hypothetical protein